MLEVWTIQLREGPEVEILEEAAAIAQVGAGKELN